MIKIAKFSFNVKHKLNGFYLMSIVTIGNRQPIYPSYLFFWIY